MPKVTRQQIRPNNRHAVTQSGGWLDRIRPVTQVDSGGLHVSLYGYGKTGKTRFISTFPKPVLIIGAEDGTRSIRTVKDVYFVKVIGNTTDPPVDAQDNAIENYFYLRDWEQFVASLDGSIYRTVAVDTASALQDLVLADVLGMREVPVQKTWGMATREDYGACNIRMRTLLKQVLDLRQHVVITAHERNFKQEEGETSELIAPKVGSALQPAVTGWLNGAVEYICQTFIRQGVKETTRRVKIGKVVKEAKSKTPTGKMEYCLRIGAHPVYMTGFRVPPGFELPDVIVDPTYEKIQALVDGEELP